MTYTMQERVNIMWHAKKIGIPEACRVHKVSHCTLYRWFKTIDLNEYIDLIDLDRYSIQKNN